jgi:hypothetical protein
MKLRRERYIDPSPSEIERGAGYVFQLDGGASDAPGCIYDNAGNACWNYRTEPRRSAYSPLNLVRKPDFVLLDHESQEVLRISRNTRVPPRFDIIQNGGVVGTIGLRSILRNKYMLTLKGGPAWTFRMPLFTIHFYGKSSVDSRVWVVIGANKTEWYLLTQAGTTDVRLVGGLAFIHREWWCYS